MSYNLDKGNTQITHKAYSPNIRIAFLPARETRREQQYQSYPSAHPHKGEALVLNWKRIGGWCCNRSRDESKDEDNGESHIDLLTL